MRSRYRFTANHKAGVEIAAPFQYDGSPKLALGYYSSIPDSFALKLFADPGVNGDPDIAACMVLVWQLR